ncbi:hypothetical protein ACN26Y_30075 [Micromonospora sp. WMMD558]|uniref:helix-turn-helix transcriptional regulator n=1 Tax=unclassified Micromonospora TaxID=2617518 RepID=UPI0012B4443C|nr:response regulator transcription factor [Micromonospora sp. WMMC415]QGN50035.1 hypothetical protein GKC29_26580 [Micromonospora sp. WMMC415]
MDIRVSAADEPAEARPGVERFNTLREVEARIRELAGGAYSVLTVHSPKRKAPDPARLATYLDWLAAGSSWRTILPRSVLATPGYLDYSLVLHRAGDLHRVADVPVQQMVIIDRTYAFVPAVPDTYAAAALQLTEPGVVAALADLFQQAWDRATDLELACESQPTDEQRQVLSLMSSVDKDSVAARRMGVSLRTYHRHVAHVMSRLGAANRFQAAARAKERGWI